MGSGGRRTTHRDNQVLKQIAFQIAKLLRLGADLLRVQIINIDGREGNRSPFVVRACFAKDPHEVGISLIPALSAELRDDSILSGEERDDHGLNVHCGRRQGKKVSARAFGIIGIGSDPPVRRTDHHVLTATTTTASREVGAGGIHGMASASESPVVSVPPTFKDGKRPCDAQAPWQIRTHLGFHFWPAFVASICRTSIEFATLKPACPLRTPLTDEGHDKLEGILVTRSTLCLNGGRRTFMTVDGMLYGIEAV
ncbi:hypothetical protein B0H15DRAFT_800982 [Mycena belliarum]|uniref:Uncharacterized protein n=1 Tax=Mycena belliarum TaxID=1033014 RepID=A0AAD6U6B6_9AGAR|nr:hypothetical protein B0H15DRAFT_800982 [Mycena belliae]